MIWAVAYLVVGMVLVGFFLGSCKVAGGWSAKMAWDQFTSEGLPGMLFLTALALGWFPAILFVFGSNILGRK